MLCETGMGLDRKVRSIWQQVSGILLIDSPELDAYEHVGLLTVIAGIRHVGLFLDVPDPHAERLIRLLRELHLRAFFGSGPQPVYDWSRHTLRRSLGFSERDPHRWVYGFVAIPTLRAPSIMELTRSRQDGCSVTPNVALMRNSKSTPLLRMRWCMVGFANLGMTLERSDKRGWLTEKYELIFKSPTESHGRPRYSRLSNTSHVNSA